MADWLPLSVSGDSSSCVVVRSYFDLYPREFSPDWVQRVLFWWGFVFVSAGEILSLQTRAPFTLNSQCDILQITQLIWCHSPQILLLRLGLKVFFFLFLLAVWNTTDQSGIISLWDLFLVPALKIPPGFTQDLCCNPLWWWILCHLDWVEGGPEGWWNISSAWVSIRN